MIGRLTGVILEKTGNEVLLEVHGVGYEVEVPLSTFYVLPNTGEAATLHTHFVVREDAQLLYGFYTPEERSLFRSLIKVNGVGPKLAITILSGVDAAGFARCVKEQDVKALVALPGVGKKTAERLIVEMKDRLPDVLSQLPGMSESVTQQPASDAMTDAELALINLGFKPQDASRALAKVDTADAADARVEDLIRSALKLLT